MKETYDLTIIGAGPAGSTAARIAAQKGLSVLVLEQKRVIGYPSHCAGGLLTLILDHMQLIPIVKDAIKARIRKFQVHSPLMRSISHDFKRNIGYIVDRPTFDQLLCDEASRNGADILTQARAIGLKRDSKAFNQVLFKYKNETHNVRSRIIIGADGVASNVAKWTGISIPRKYLGIGYSYNAENLRNISSDTIEIYFLSALPGGFAWIFPQGIDKANVGLGGYNSGTYMRKIFEWFKRKHRIASSKLSRVRLTDYTGGIIPGSKIPSRTTFDYGMIVGDAANQVDALTGEGIRLALICGELAGQIAAFGIKKNDLSYIHNYHKLWRKRTFLELYLSRILRYLFLRFNSEDFDIFVKAISRTNLNILFNKRRWIPLFLHSILKTPSVLKPFRKIFQPLPQHVKVMSKSSDSFLSKNST